MGGILVVATSWSGNFLRIRKATLYNNVALLLERKVTELDAQYRGKPLTEVVDADGDFGSDLPQYRWTFAQREFVMPDLSSSLLGDEGSKDEMLLQFVKQTTEFISKSVKEGTVTVFVKAGKKEVAFSVTNYFVDYTQEMNLPGLPGGAPGGGGAPKPGGGK